MQGASLDRKKPWRMPRFDRGRIIGLIFAFSCLYLVLSIVYPWINRGRFKLPEPQTRVRQHAEFAAGPERKPIESYIEDVGGRRIFGGASGATAAPQAAVSADIAGDMNLVGIISGENPQAVIEDKKNQRTYYLSEGQMIGDLRVDSIQEGKIILDRMGQKFELHL